MIGLMGVCFIVCLCSLGVLVGVGMTGTAFPIVFGTIRSVDTNTHRGLLFFRDHQLNMRR
jgi:hypothetical protein